MRHQAYQAIKNLILSADLHPGEHLSELRLSELIGVSRTPLREALMLLEAEGLVIGRSNRGYTVVHFDPARVRELLVAREGLDGYAAELACREASKEDIAAIRSTMRQIEALDRKRDPDAPNTALELRLGLDIHNVIAAATHNATIQEMTRRLYEQLRVGLWLEVLWLDAWDDAVVEHRRIVDAIVARDVPRAVQAARDHVRGSLNNMARIEQLYAERRSLFRSHPPR